MAGGALGLRFFSDQRLGYITSHLTNDVASVRAAARMPAITGRVTFERVGFRYNDSVDVLKDISADVEPGEIVEWWVRLAPENPL